MGEDKWMIGSCENVIRDEEVIVVKEGIREVRRGEEKWKVVEVKRWYVW
jgi:hypothetical protein